MKKEKEILSREERKRRMYRRPREYDWIFVMTGTEKDITSFISILLMDPGLFVLFIYYMFLIELNIPLTYLIGDAIFIFWWCRKALRKKRWLEETEDIDYMPILRRKLEELGELDARRRQEKQQKTEQ